MLPPDRRIDLTTSLPISLLYQCGKRRGAELESIERLDLTFSARMRARPFGGYGLSPQFAT
jgi:hypothetical protein